MSASEAERAQKRERQARFLAHYKVVGNITTACQLAGIGNRTTIYEWQTGLGGDTFTVQLQEARVQATELLEEEARRRAVEGWLEPVYQRGLEVGHVRKYDSGLLSLLLQANAPEKYRTRVDVRASQEADIEDTLTEAQREAFRAVMVQQLPAPAPESIDAEYTTIEEGA